MMNPWMVFLQKHRALNPNMSPIEAAKSASKLYKVAKNNQITSTLGKTMSFVSSSKSRKRRRGKKHKGTRRR